MILIATEISKLPYVHLCAHAYMYHVKIEGLTVKNMKEIIILDGTSRAFSEDMLVLIVEEK